MADELKKEVQEEEEYEKAWAEQDAAEAKEEGSKNVEGLPEHPAPEPPEEEPEETPPAEDEKDDKASLEKALKDTKAWGTKLSEEKKALEEKLAAYEKGDGDITKEDVEEAKKKVDDAEADFKAKADSLYEDYPELKAVLDPLLDSHKKTVERLDALEKEKAEDEESVKAREIREHYDKNVKPKVLKVHSDFEESIIFTRDKDGNQVPNEAYFKWAEKQRPALKTAAMTSNDPEDIIWAVDEYKKYLASPEAEELRRTQEQERETKITNAQTLRAGATPPFPSGSTKKDKEDYEAGWNEAGDELEKEGVG